MPLCRACGTQTIDLGVGKKQERCPSCGAVFGTLQPDASQVKLGIFSECSTFTLGQLFQFLGIPDSELAYMSQRPVPRPGEAEFDTRHDLPWPEMAYRWIISSGRLIPDLPWMQSFFLKFPMRPPMRSIVFGVPSGHWRYLRNEARTPAMRKAREVVMIELLRGMIPAVLMLLFAGGISVAMTRLTPGDPAAVGWLFISIVVVGIVMRIGTTTANYLTDGRLADLTKADIRRQVLRYLAWVKQRRMEEGGDAVPHAPPVVRY